MNKISLGVLKSKSISIKSGRDFDKWLSDNVPADYHEQIKSHRRTYIQLVKKRKQASQ